MLITGLIPESLGQLTNLDSLTLSGNKLTGKTMCLAAALVSFRNVCIASFSLPELHAMFVLHFWRRPP